MTRAICILLLCVASYCSRIPPTFKRCYRKQNDFEKCLVEAVKIAFSQLTKPMAEIGLPSLDPLVIPSVHIGIGKSAAGFSQDFKNLSLYGLSRINCTEFKINFEEKIMNVQCFPPELHVAFDYEVKGKILILPIYGKGPGTLAFVKPHVNLTFYVDEYEKKGKKYWKVNKTVFKLGPEQLVFKLSNLLGGDKLLNDNINEVFNENWRLLYDDIGEGYEEAFAAIYTFVLNGMFTKISIDELFGEE